MGQKVTDHLASGARSGRSVQLGDFGADVGIVDPENVKVPPIFADAPQAFVKFIGDKSNRVPLSLPVIEAIKSRGCHRVLCYPESKRPKIVRDGAVMFIARFTGEPDIRIFGRAIGMRHEAGRDDATHEDIKKHDWVKRRPRYIRVHHAEFIAGTLANDVSLNKLMDELKADSFASTQENTARGEGNTDPRRAYRQQPQVRLSTDGLAWLNEQLQAAFDAHGAISHRELDKLD